MKDEKAFRPGIIDILLFALSVLFFVGARTWFQVCDKMTDSGAYMTCHWAGEALKAGTLLVMCLCAVHALLPRSMKMGLDCALMGLGVLLMRLPGGVIALCGHTDMACRAHTQPWTLVMALLLILMSALHICLSLSAISRARHARREN